MRIGTHEDSRHPELHGGIDVALEVVEKDRPLGNHAADLREGVGVDPRVGLAHADFARVDHGVEQLVRGEQRAPACAKLARVVGHEGGAIAIVAKPPRSFDHRFAHPPATRARRTQQQLQGVDVEALVNGDCHDLLASTSEVDFAALEAVPRVIVILVVRPEDDFE